MVTLETVILKQITDFDLVATTLFLGFWTAGSIPGFSQGDYMATYAGIGVATAVVLFSLSFTIR